VIFDNKKGGLSFQIDILFYTKNQYFGVISKIEIIRNFTSV